MTGRVWKWTCQECTDEGRRGYCAPNRCYCGHGRCHAYASWVDARRHLSPLPNPRKDTHR